MSCFISCRNPFPLEVLEPPEALFLNQRLFEPPTWPALEPRNLTMLLHALVTNLQIPLKAHIFLTCFGASGEGLCLLRLLLQDLLCGLYSWGFCFDNTATYGTLWASWNQNHVNSVIFSTDRLQNQLIYLNIASILILTSWIKSPASTAFFSTSRDLN